MVRYSKLAFRLLVQEYGVDMTYTPMILAHEYARQACNFVASLMSSQISPSSSGTRLGLFYPPARGAPDRTVRFERPYRIRQGCETHITVG